MKDYGEDIDSALKAYKRFLKDYGIYYRVFNVYSKKFHSYEEFKNEARIMLNSPLRFLSNSSFFCSWANTQEGRLFWWKYSILWKIKCVNESIGRKYDDSCKRMTSIITKSYLSNITSEEKKSHESFIMKEFIQKFI